MSAIAPTLPSPARRGRLRSSWPSLACGGPAGPLRPAGQPGSATARSPRLRTPVGGRLPARRVGTCGGSPWWNDRVFYEVFVRSFADSDGDGIGDLRGLIDRLDYLNDGDPATSDDLGVTGLWLMPVAESPELPRLRRARLPDHRARLRHGRGPEAPRRRRPRARDRGHRRPRGEPHLGRAPLVRGRPATRASAHDDWYVWRDSDPGYPRPGRAAGLAPARRDRWYYGLFWEGMPDLDLAEPGRDRRARRHRPVLARGRWASTASGSTPRSTSSRTGQDAGRTRRQTLAWLEGASATRPSRPCGPTRCSSARSGTSTSIAVVVRPRGSLDLTFEFELADGISSAIRLERRRAALVGVEREVAGGYPAGQYATFLTNHDQTRVMTELGGDAGRGARRPRSLLLTGARRAVHLLRRGDRDERAQARRADPDADALDRRTRRLAGSARPSRGSR